MIHLYHHFPAGKSHGRRKRKGRGVTSKTPGPTPPSGKPTGQEGHPLHYGWKMTTALDAPKNTNDDDEEGDQVIQNHGARHMIFASF